LNSSPANYYLTFMTSIFVVSSGTFKVTLYPSFLFGHFTIVDINLDFGPVNADAVFGTTSILN